VLWSDLCTARVSLTDAAMCMNLTNESWFNTVISADFDDLRVFSLAMQNKLELSVCLSDIVRYFIVIVIFYCTNTTGFHMSDWKFSEGGC